MKTYGKLWPRLVTWENVLAAYRKCRRRKRYKPDAVRFHAAWETNLLELLQALRTGRYEPGEYRHFEVFEPKRRTISAAPFRDRVVHHALVRVLEPLFERRFIFDSYACRKGKGTHAALDRAQGYLRRQPYYLKTDIVKFYPNVDHEILLVILERHVRDERVLDLARRIVASGDGVGGEGAEPQTFAGDDLLAILRPRGLPIGNLTSQFFANVLLDDVDHFIKEVLRVPGYVRYADDMVLFGPSKSVLWQYRDALAARLARLRLKLHEGKTQVRPSSQGLKFLGLVLGRSGRRLQQSGAMRFNRRLRRLRWLMARREATARDIGSAIRAWTAHARQANSAGLRRELWKRLRF